MTTRTQDEILTRIADAADEDDMFGFRREVLIDALDYEHAKAFLQDGVTPEQWAEARMGDMEEAARRYLGFAVGKIVDHRGISAGRSVDKLREFAWLMGRDDVVEAMDAADYPRYGAPQVKAFADALGWPFLEATDDADDRAALERMAAGRPCTDDCDAGC